MRTDIYWSSKSPSIVFSKILLNLLQGGKTLIWSAWENGKQSVLSICGGYGEPQIWSTHDRQGNLRWHLQDPRTEKQYVFESELEVRCWLEQRYNMNNSNPDRFV